MFDFINNGMNDWIKMHEFHGLKLSDKLGASTSLFVDNKNVVFNQLITQVT